MRSFRLMPWRQSRNPFNGFHAENPIPKSAWQVSVITDQQGTPYKKKEPDGLFFLIT